jgi:hypothetical protein
MSINYLNNPQYRRYASIFLISVLIIMWIILATTSCVKKSDWFFHPDERDAYTFSLNLYKKGTLTATENLNSKFQGSIFTPTGSTSHGNQILPGRSLGIYILEAPMFIFGDKGPFYLTPLMGIVCALYLYLMIKKSINTGTAVLVTIFFAFSPQFLFWNNMLFSNVPALAFLLAGIYYLMYEQRKFILAGIFLASAIMLRYEFVFFVIIFLFFYVFYKNKGKWAVITHTPLIIVILLMLIFIPLLNKELYGSYLSFGYTQNAFDQHLQRTINYQVDNKDSLLMTLKKYANRFGGQFADKNFFKNENITLRQYILGFSPILVIGTIVGVKPFIEIFRRKITYRYLFLAIFFMAFFSVVYFSSSNGYNGYGKGWLVGSYSRYLLLVIVFMSLTSGVLVKKLWDYGKISITFSLMFIYIIFSINQFHNAPFGIDQVNEAKEQYFAVNNIATSLPKNSVIVSNFYSKAIISRPVLTPSLIPVSRDKIASATLTDINDLLKTKRVYVFENPSHSSYLNLENDLHNDTNLKIKYINPEYGFYEVLKK